MGIKLPDDNSGKSEKLKIEELKSETKKYEKNAEFFTELLKLGKEVSKAYQKFKDAEIAETEWKGKNDLEAKKIEKAFIDLEKQRMRSENSSKELELQKDQWSMIKKYLQSQLKLIDGLPVSEDRHKLMDQTNTLLERFSDIKTGK